MLRTGKATRTTHDDEDDDEGNDLSDNDDDGSGDEGATIDDYSDDNGERGRKSQRERAKQSETKLAYVFRRWTHSSCR